MRIRQAAPSLKVDELGAVTVPPTGLKAGLTALNLSSFN
jgi:hypothetical protein